MAITQVLLQSNFSSSPMLQQTFHSRASFPSCANKPKYSLCRIKISPKFNIKCLITNPNSEPEKAFGENRDGGNHSFKKVTTNGVIWRSMENVIKTSLITGVLSALMFLYDHRQSRLALAASGGRMGGSSFSSDTSSDYSSSSWSSTSSYSSPSSSSSYYSSDSSWDSSPESNTYITQINSPTTMSSGPEVKPIGLDVIFAITVCIFMFYGFVKWRKSDIDIAKTSVLKLQVGSLGTGRSLQRNLNRIAKVADTSNSEGLHYVLQESILALLRNSNNCTSGYSSVDVKWSVAGCEKRFTQLSVEERGKFDEETLVNVNNIRNKIETSQSSNGLPNEYIVVTIIVAARGVPELPLIKSGEQLKEALQKLASISASNIMGAEVLWTPQKEDDSLTEQQMLEDYPHLHPL